MDVDTNNQCILFFAKSPIKGQVKTRLSAEIGDDQAVELYKCFVEDLIALLEGLKLHFKCCFRPPDAKQVFIKWLGQKHCYIPQTGDNLGERLENAFRMTFEENFTKALVIGSDSPDLPADFLREALQALDTYDAVVGPCLDGGYYLIGFTKQSFVPQVFEGVSWSTPLVCGQTLNTLRKHKLKVYLLPRWYDVDVLSDLNKLVLRNKDTAFLKSKTLTFIHKTVCQRVNQKEDKND